MEVDLQEFLEGMQSPSSKFTLKELKEREEVWRGLWSWTPEEVKYFLLRIGSTVRVVKRNYQGSVGELGEVKFEAKEVELVVIEKSYNYTDGKEYLERKVVKIPFSAISWFEFIQKSILAEEADTFTVEPIPEEAKAKE